MRIAPIWSRPRHIEVLLPDGVGYRAGDHVSIVPQNAAALVERACAASRSRPVPMSCCRQPRAGVPTCRSARRSPCIACLSDFVELQHPATRKQIQTLAQNTRCPFTRPKLETLLDEEKLPRRDPDQAQSPCSTCSKNIRPASLPFGGVPRDAAADDAALLLDLVITDGRRQPLFDHRRGGRGPGALGCRRLSRVSARTTATPGGRVPRSRPS